MLTPGVAATVSPDGGPTAASMGGTVSAAAWPARRTPLRFRDDLAALDQVDAAARWTTSSDPTRVLAKPRRPPGGPFSPSARRPTLDGCPPSKRSSSRPVAMHWRIRAAPSPESASAQALSSPPMPSHPSSAPRRSRPRISTASAAALVALLPRSGHRCGAAVQLGASICHRCAGLLHGGLRRSRRRGQGRHPRLARLRRLRLSQPCAAQMPSA